MEDAVYEPGRVYPVSGNGFKGKFPPVLCIAEDESSVMFCAACGWSGEGDYRRLSFDPTMAGSHIQGTIEYDVNGDPRCAFIAGAMFMVGTTPLEMRPCDGHWYGPQWWSETDAEEEDE